MKEQVANSILKNMAPSLNDSQMMKLQYVIHKEFNEIVISEREHSNEEYETVNILILERFINTKRLEGCIARELWNLMNFV